MATVGSSAKNLTTAVVRERINPPKNDHRLYRISLGLLGEGFERTGAHQESKGSGKQRENSESLIVVGTVTFDVMETNCSS
jgi:hypothetical protein